MNKYALCVGLVAALAAHGEAFLARETARVRDRLGYSVGLFEPSKLGVGNGIELQANPLLFLVAPNLDVRVAHLQGAAWALTGEYGAWVPTPALRLTKGFLFPSQGKEVPWFVVPHAGLRASFGQVESHVFTLMADVAFGIPLSKSQLTPMGAWPVLEVQLAPIYGGVRGQVGMLYDYKVSNVFRLRGYADAYVQRASPSVLTLRGGLNVDIRLGKMSRVSLGGLWWNADQHAVDPQTFQRVRSNDFLPTVDFIWAG